MNLPKAGTVDAAMGRHGPPLGGQKVQQQKGKGTAGGFYVAPEEPSSIVGTKVATREKPRGGPDAKKQGVDGKMSSQCLSINTH